MNGNDDLERKDDHLGKHAALAKVETGIEIVVNPEGQISIDTTDSAYGGVYVSVLEYAVTAYQARLLADALLEAADKAEGTGLKGTTR